MSYHFCDKELTKHRPYFEKQSFSFNEFRIALNILPHLTREYEGDMLKIQPSYG